MPAPPRASRRSRRRSHSATSMSRSAAGTRRATRRARRGRRRQRQQDGVPVARARASGGTTTARAVGFELAQHLGEEPRRLARAMRRVATPPRPRETGAEIAQQVRQDLPHRLRLLRQLRQVVPIVDRPLAEALPRMPNARAVAADDGDRRGARPGRRDRARPSDTAPSTTRPRRAPAPAARPSRTSSPRRQTRTGSGAEGRALPPRSAPRSVSPAPSRPRGEPGIHPREQRLH